MGGAVLRIEKSVVEKYLVPRFYSEQEYLLPFEHFDKIPKSAFELVVTPQ